MITNNKADTMFESIANSIEKPKIFFDNTDGVVQRAHDEDLKRGEIKAACSDYQILLNKVVKKLARHQEKPPEQADFDLLNNILSK